MRAAAVLLIAGLLAAGAAAASERLLDRYPESVLYDRLREVVPGV